MKYLFGIVFFVSSFGLSGQNLVPNGDFELIFSYPLATTTISDYSKNWFTAYSSPDIFYIIPDSLPQPYQERAIPDNQFGVQNTYSGNGYAGLFTHSVGFIIHGNGRREWLGVRLADTLRKNSIYCFTMYISLAEISDYANDKIGIYCSEDSFYNDINSPAPFPIDTEKLAFTDLDFYTNVNGWDTLILNYKAKGGEQYLYIGNFFPDSLVNWIHAGNGEQIGSTYYYIDNVSLFKCGVVGMEEIVPDKISIYPNPAQDYVSIDLPEEYTKPQLSIYNLTGQLLLQKQLNTANQQVSISELSNGIYIFVVQNKDKVVGRQRVIIAK